MGVILKADNITKSYSESVLKGISLEIREKTFTAILGPSGSGKSTLLNILSGQLKPGGGEVSYGEAILTSFSRRRLADWKRSETGIVFQNSLLLDSLTAEENISVGICPGRPALSMERLTKQLDIDGILHSFPSQLSGGQQQRVAIARAVIKNPRLLFCDEATGSLDEENSKRVVSLLHGLKSAYGLTILFTTHNSQIARTADRVLTIKNGLLFRDEIHENPVPADEMDWG